MSDDTNALKKGTKPLEDWKAAIRSGMRYRRIFGKSKEWKRYKNYYRGFFGKKVVPVNIIYSIGRALIPQIYFRNPKVTNYPMRPGLAMHARLIDRIDNWLLTEQDVKYQLKSMTLDSYLCGRGMGILGYDTEYGHNPSFESDMYADSGLTSFGKKGERIEYNDVVKPGLPWFLRCNPMDFIVPWGTSKWEDAPWFAFRKMRPLRDVKEDPKYPKGAKAGLKGVFRSRMDYPESDVPEEQRRKYEEDSTTEWVELWQIHDKRTGRLYVISLDHPKFLRDDIDYLQVEGLPARVLGFNEDPDYFWWTPDARLIEAQQLEMNDVRTMAKAHRKVGLLKILYEKNLLGKDELVKLLDADPKAAVGIDTGGMGDIRKAVAMVQSHVPPDLSLAAREIREDVREIVGFSRNQAGAFEAPSGRRTATEAGIVQQASMIRIDERRDVMADLLSSVVRAFNQYIYTNWTEARVADVIGPDNVRYWVKFTGKQIKGEYMTTVNPEEGIPEDKRTRKQGIQEFMQAAIQVPDINKKYLFEEWARQYEFLDPQMLFPGSGLGRSPERPMPFEAFTQLGQGRNAMSEALGG